MEILWLVVYLPSRAGAVKALVRDIRRVTAWNSKQERREGWWWRA
jgi:hypothetical protein